MQANIPETAALYRSIRESSLCDCHYCRSYRSQIRSAYPEVAAYLASLGIDIEKPYETSPLEPDEREMLVYCGCQYIVLGQCDPGYHHKIGDVDFRMATSYPSTGLKEAHFLIEFSPIRLEYAP